MAEYEQKVRGPLAAAQPECSPGSQTESHLLSAQRERPPGARFWHLPLRRLAPEWLIFPTFRLPPPGIWYFPDNPEQMLRVQHVLRPTGEKLDTNSSFKNN